MLPLMTCITLNAEHKWQSATVSILCQFQGLKEYLDLVLRQLVKSEAHRHTQIDGPCSILDGRRTGWSFQRPSSARENDHPV